MATERRPSRSGKAERTASSSPVPLRPVGSRGGMPAQERALRARGRNTMRRLLDAGVVVFEKRGYQAARVDDIVKEANTSHGTFYLYFASKEDLFRSLAVDVAAEMTALAASLGPVGPDTDGYAELRDWLDRFSHLYERYQPHGGAHQLLLLGQGQKLGAGHAGVAPPAVGEVAHGQAPVGTAVPAVGHRVGGDRGRAGCPVGYLLDGASVQLRLDPALVGRRHGSGAHRVQGEDVLGVVHPDAAHQPRRARVPPQHVGH